MAHLAGLACLGSGLDSGFAIQGGIEARPSQSGHLTAGVERQRCRLTAWGWGVPDSG